jgi:hypothetical protein
MPGLQAQPIISSVRGKIEKTLALMADMTEE